MCVACVRTHRVLLATTIWHFFFSLYLFRSLVRLNVAIHIARYLIVPPVSSAMLIIIAITSVCRMLVARECVQIAAEQQVKSIHDNSRYTLRELIWATVNYFSRLFVFFNLFLLVSLSLGLHKYGEVNALLHIGNAVYNRIIRGATVASPLRSVQLNPREIKIDTNACAMLPTGRTALQINRAVTRATFMKRAIAHTTQRKAIQTWLGRNSRAHIDKPAKM